MMDKDIDKILTAKSEQVKKLQEIVKKAIEEETLITNNLLNPPKEILTRGQTISDKVAKFGGSWAFIISFFIVLVVWVLFNTLTPARDNFDPYPFILLNLVLSCLSALQAPVILMSQNRQAQRDRIDAKYDHAINRKAERENLEILKDLDYIKRKLRSTK